MSGLGPAEIGGPALAAHRRGPDRLVVTFQDGTNGVADLSSVLAARECGIHEPLKDSAFFEQAGVERGVITWPNGADLDPV